MLTKTKGARLLAATVCLAVLAAPVHAAESSHGDGETTTQADPHDHDASGVDPAVQARQDAKLARVTRALERRDLDAQRVSVALDAANLAAEKAQRAADVVTRRQQAAAHAHLTAAAAELDAALAHAALTSFARDMATSESSETSLIMAMVVNGESPAEALRVAESSRRVSGRVADALEQLVDATAQAHAAREVVARRVAAAQAAERTARRAARDAARLVVATRDRLASSQDDLSSLVAGTPLADLAAGRFPTLSADDLGCAPADPDMPVVNGMLPATVLCSVPSASGHFLRTDAAAAFELMSAAYRRHFSAPLCITDSYRSYAAQVSAKARKPYLAATPGTSNHGWGMAIDACDGINSFGTPQHEWMRANAGLFGWFHPGWAQADGSKPEPWHWEFSPELAEQMRRVYRSLAADPADRRKPAKPDATDRRSGTSSR